MSMEPVGELTVTRVRPLTPRMVRVSFGAPAGFTSWPDQQLKLLFPRGGALRLPASDDDQMRWYQAFLAIPEAQRPWMRSFTVRRHDPARAELDVDFVLHGAAGPAARWAASAAPGQVLGRYGPSAVYSRQLAQADSYLLAGDETALPAIGSLLETLPPSRTVVFIEVADRGEEQPLPPAEVVWLHRSAGESVEAAARGAELPPGSVSAWLAGEAGAVRALRRHLVAQGVPKHAIEFAGYWRRTLTQDDPPTEDDLAEAHERLAQAQETG